MLRAGVGLSAHRDSGRAAADAGESALRAIASDSADVVLVFATTPHGPGFTRVTRTVAELCGTRQVVGCSAAGVLADGQDIEGGPAVAVLALAGDVVARRFFVPLARGESERVADDIARSVGAVGDGERLLILFADPYHLEAEPLFAALERRLPGVPVIGGGASEDGSVGQVSVFCGDTAESGAVAGVLLTGGIRATVGVTHAVRRLSAVRTVTRAHGNWVLALDGRPAYEAFAAAVPRPLLEDVRRALGVVLAGFPVGGNEYVSRHLAGIDTERGAVAVAAPIAEGDEMFFGVRDPVGAREDLQRMLARQAGAWESCAPAAALYVNCVGRGRSFYGVPGLDGAYIGRQLGGLPVAGFFSGAEFAPGAGAARLHQYTGVLTMFGAQP